MKSAAAKRILIVILAFGLGVVVGVAGTIAVDLDRDADVELEMWQMAIDHGAARCEEDPATHQRRFSWTTDSPAIGPPWKPVLEVTNQPTITLE